MQAERAVSFKLKKGSRRPSLTKRTSLRIDSNFTSQEGLSKRSRHLKAPPHVMSSDWGNQLSHTSDNSRPGTLVQNSRKTSVISDETKLHQQQQADPLPHPKREKKAPLFRSIFHRRQKQQESEAKKANPHSYDYWKFRQVKRVKSIHEPTLTKFISQLQAIEKQKTEMQKKIDDLKMESKTRKEFMAVREGSRIVTSPSKDDTGTVQNDEILFENLNQDVPQIYQRHSQSPLQQEDGEVVFENPSEISKRMFQRPNTAKNTRWSKGRKGFKKKSQSPNRTVLMPKVISIKMKDQIDEEADRESFELRLGPSKPMLQTYESKYLRQKQINSSLGQKSRNVSALITSSSPKRCLSNEKRFILSSAGASKTQIAKGAQGRTSLEQADYEEQAKLQFSEERKNFASNDFGASFTSNQNISLANQRKNLIRSAQNRQQFYDQPILFEQQQSDDQTRQVRPSLSPTSNHFSGGAGEYQETKHSVNPNPKGTAQPKKTLKNLFKGTKQLFRNKDKQRTLKKLLAKHMSLTSANDQTADQTRNSGTANLREQFNSSLSSKPPPPLAQTSLSAAHYHKHLRQSTRVSSNPPLSNPPPFVRQSTKQEEASKKVQVSTTRVRPMSSAGGGFKIQRKQDFSSENRYRNNSNLATSKTTRKHTSASNNWGKEARVASAKSRTTTQPPTNLEDLFKNIDIKSVGNLFSPTTSQQDQKLIQFVKDLGFYINDPKQQGQFVYSKTQQSSIQPHSITESELKNYLEFQAQCQKLHEEIMSNQNTISNEQSTSFAPGGFSGLNNIYPSKQQSSYLQKIESRMGDSNRPQPSIEIPSSKLMVEKKLEGSPSHFKNTTGPEKNSALLDKASDSFQLREFGNSAQSSIQNSIQQRHFSKTELTKQIVQGSWKPNQEVLPEKHGGVVFINAALKESEQGVQTEDVPAFLDQETQKKTNSELPEDEEGNVIIDMLYPQETQPTQTNHTNKQSKDTNLLSLNQPVQSALPQTRVPTQKFTMSPTSAQQYAPLTLNSGGFPSRLNHPAGSDPSSSSIEVPLFVHTLKQRYSNQRSLHPHYQAPMDMEEIRKMVNPHKNLNEVLQQNLKLINQRDRYSLKQSRNNDEILQKVLVHATISSLSSPKPLMSQKLASLQSEMQDPVPIYNRISQGEAVIEQGEASEPHNFEATFDPRRRHGSNEMVLSAEHDLGNDIGEVNHSTDGLINEVDLLEDQPFVSRKKKMQLKYVYPEANLKRININSQLRQTNSSLGIQKDTHIQARITPLEEKKLKAESKLEKDKGTLQKPESITQPTRPELAMMLSSSPTSDNYTKRRREDRTSGMCNKDLTQANIMGRYWTKEK